jgi:hypothetical protein
MGQLDDIIGGVVDGAFDPRRSDSENMGRIRDALSQFGSPGGRDQDQVLALRVMDEIKRRRGSVPEQALRTASADPDPGGPAGYPPPDRQRGAAGPAGGGGGGASLGDWLILLVAEKQREHAHILIQNEDLGAAERLLVSSIETFRAHGDTPGVFMTLCDLGVVAMLQGRSLASSGRPDLAADTYARAKHLFLESLRLRYLSGPDEATDGIRINLGNLATNMYYAAEMLWANDQGTATWLFREALVAARETRNAEFVLEIQNGLLSYGIVL